MFEDDEGKVDIKKRNAVMNKKYTEVNVKSDE
jgi:hypothetical protein